MASARNLESHLGFGSVSAPDLRRTILKKSGAIDELYSHCAAILRFFGVARAYFIHSDFRSESRVIDTEKEWYPLGFFIMISP
jgi:hypothetical protein